MTTSDPSRPNPDLPIAVIGAGPVGLAAAAHLAERGRPFLVFEAGPAVGSAVRNWAHVRLFSPWEHLVDPVSRRLLEAVGWEAPPPARLPTGGELVERYLEPLAALPAIAPRLRLGRKVVAVTRRGMDKVKTEGRTASPFEVVAQSADGGTERHAARAVVDASGTWRSPNPLGAGGIPAEGEEALASRVRHGIPDVLGAERADYAGCRTLVVGSGHSAFNVVLDLARLAESAPGTGVIWAVRRDEPGSMFGGGAADALEARGSLGQRLRSLVESGAVPFVTGFEVEGLADSPAGLRIRARDGREIGPVDRVVAATGFRPDLSVLRELRLELDPWLEAPVRLAPLIDPNLHDCGTVEPHGWEALRHPETDAFVVGMKSYGRAPTFLLLTGYEQVRSIVAGLAGDMKAALDLRLTLPETGVCCSDVQDAPCCGGGREAARPASSAFPSAGGAGGPAY